MENVQSTITNERTRTVNVGNAEKMKARKEKQNKTNKVMELVQNTTIKERTRMASVVNAERMNPREVDKGNEKMLIDGYCLQKKKRGRS